MVAGKFAIAALAIAPTAGFVMPSAPMPARAARVAAAADVHMIDIERKTGDNVEQ